MNEYGKQQSMTAAKRVQRRSLACARCRSRKSRCDASLSPSSCKQCLQSGLPCVAFSSSTNKPAPRSIAQYLENEIATRERLHPSTQSAFSRTQGNEALQARVMKDFTPSFLGISAAVPFARCAVVGTRIPSTRLFGATDIDEHHPRSILNPLPMGTPLDSIPNDASKYLFDNYMNRVVAQYPIFYSADLIAYYTCFYPSSSDAPFGAAASPYEIYVISLVMAISLTTAARTQQVRASSIASGLFRNALRQIPSVLTNDIKGLQALLLLLQYAFLDPGAANIWLLSGLSSQVCIDLGLHQELPTLSKVSFLERDMRRRIFWCAYEMDIAVCAALLRPSTLLMKHINVGFPTEFDDSSISQTGVDLGGRAPKLTCLRIWRFRQIESEIVSVLFHDADISPSTSSLETWMQRMEDTIIEWNAEVHRSSAANLDASMASQWAEMDLYANIATPYIIVTLFRPCHRIREPTSKNLMKAFIAAVSVADGYWRQANLDFGNSKYVFHPCHHTFSAAVAFLQALQRCKESVYTTYTLEKVEAFMGTFSMLFATMAERWTAASRCLEEYERLLAPVKKDYIEFVIQRAQSNSISHSIPGIDISEFQGDLLDSSFNLDEMFNFGSFFNPSHVSPTEEKEWLYSSVPKDWNVEFDFENI